MSDPGIQNIYQWTPASSDNAQWNDAANWTLTSGPGHGGSDEFPSGSSDQADFVTGTVDCFIASPLTIGAIRTIGWYGAINSTTWQASHEITSFAFFNTGGFRAMNESRLIFTGNSTLRVGSQFNWLIVAATRPALVFQGTNTFTCEKSSLALGASGSLTVEDGAELTINGRGTLVVERLSNLGSIINDAEIRTADYATPANISFGKITGSGIVTITRRSTGEAVFPAFDISCNIIVARNDGVSVFSGRASHVAFEGALNTNIAFDGFEAGSMVIEPAATKLAVRSGGLSVTGNITNTGSANAASSWSQADGAVVKLSGTQDQEIDWPFHGGSATFGVEKTAGRLMLRGEPMNMYGLIHRDPASQDPTSVTEMELVVGGSLGSQVTTMIGDLAAAATVVNSTLIIPSGVTLDTKAFTALHGSQTTGAGTIRVKSGEFADPENTVSENIEIEEWGAGTPPESYPVNFSATGQTVDAIYLSWNAVEKATIYDVERSVNQSEWSQAFSSESISGSDYGLNAGSRYYYRIRSTNASGSSEWSPVLTSATKPPLTNFAVIEVTNNSITVVWDSLSSDDTYNVSHAASGGEEIVDATGTTTNPFTITNGIAADTIYSISVSRIRYGVENRGLPIVQRTLLNPVQNVSVSGITMNSAEVSWTKHENNYVTRYRIETSIDGVSWTGKGTSTGTSFSITGLDPSVLYYVRIIAEQTGFFGNNTSFPASIQFTTLPPVPSIPTGLTGFAVSTTQVNLSWNAVENATSYDIERSMNGSMWTPSYSGSETTAAVTGLTDGTRYFWRVNATGQSGTSEWSEPVSIWTIQVPPRVFTATPVSETEIQIRATQITGGIVYTLQKQVAGIWSTIREFESGFSFNDTGLSPGTLYEYRVNVTNPDGAASDWAYASATTPFPVPSIPVLSVASQGSRQINASWNAVEYADEYELQEMMFGNPFVTVYTGPDTSFYSTGLTPDTEHNYRVRAIGSGGISEWSEMASTDTEPETTDSFIRCRALFAATPLPDTKVIGV